MGTGERRGVESQRVMERREHRECKPQAALLPTVRGYGEPCKQGGCQVASLMRSLANVLACPGCINLK